MWPPNTDKERQISCNYSWACARARITRHHRDACFLWRKTKCPKLFRICEYSAVHGRLWHSIKFWCVSKGHHLNPPTLVHIHLFIAIASASADDRHSNRVWFSAKYLFSERSQNAINRWMVISLGSHVHCVVDMSISKINREQHYYTLHCYRNGKPYVFFFVVLKDTMC